MTNLDTILVVDDEPQSLRLVTEILASGGYEVRPADSGELALESTRAKRPALILMDLRMPGLSGFEVYRRLKDSPESRDIPVIFVSSSHRSDEHVEGLRLGAVDFITKPFRSEELLARVHTHLELARFRSKLELLVAQQTRELQAANEQLQRELVERRMIEEALRESERRFRDVADTAPVAIWVCDPDGKLTFFNKQGLSSTGRTMEQLTAGGWRELIHPDDLEKVSSEYSAAVAERRGYRVEARFQGADGEYRWMLHTSMPRFIGGTYAGRIGTLNDITDLKWNQENVLATQKLESMGVLTAGIAHDFNNLLASICAEADLALSQTPGDSPVRECLDRIGCVAIRGSQVLNSMLDYAGGKEDNAAFERVDLSSLIQDTLEFLKASVLKTAELQINVETDLPSIRANRAQIRRLVMNLITNASESLGGQEGRIQLVAGRVHVSAGSRFAGGTSVPAGEYVVLQVSDNGHGITEQAQARIFDPFYTTKQMGRGLGLSAVQGILHSHGGAIRVTSEPGRGCSFQVFLPFWRAPEQELLGKKRVLEAPPALPNRTILLVEDEETLRLAISMSLARNGFLVLTAANGREAVDLFCSRADDVGAILLDLTLPGLSGPEVFREVRRVNPKVKILITSAYGLERVASDFDLGAEHYSGFIRKPYRIAELVKKLREALSQDEPNGRTEAPIPQKK